MTRQGGRFAEAATPVPGSQSVLLVQSPLREALATVRLLRNRLLLAGALALVGALGVGYFGAWLFARRLRRLETAAERIASGQFDEPIDDTAADEVGQLARAFDRMRERLAVLDHARREFIANASHELRTPVFALGGFLELLSDEELDEETRREFLGTMREQVDRLAKLATELLDLSRSDAGRLRVEQEPVDLARAAADVAEEFSALARAGGRRLELEDSGETTAVGDEQRVLQIGRALVENALVHTPTGTTVRIRAAHGALEVEDDGPGIPSEHAPQVFDRFYRVDGQRASGSGLGLAIASELARAMGGSLELESAPGRTVFALRLPPGSRAAQPSASRPPKKHVETHADATPDNSSREVIGVSTVRGMRLRVPAVIAFVRCCCRRRACPARRLGGGVVGPGRSHRRRSGDHLRGGDLGSQSPPADRRLLRPGADLRAALLRCGHDLLDFRLGNGC